MTHFIRAAAHALLVATALAVAPQASLRAQGTVTDTTPAALDTAAILASARADIEAANAAWLPGLRERNADLITAAYADDGIFVTADGAIIRGRPAVTQMYTERFPRLRQILDGGVVQDGMAVASATRIYEWGHAWLEMARPDGTRARTGGAYLTVWELKRDGHWHIARNLAL